jgi:hypothetical protein
LNGAAKKARNKRSSPIIAPAYAIPLRHQRGCRFRYTQVPRNAVRLITHLLPLAGIDQRAPSRKAAASV